MSQDLFAAFGEAPEPTNQIISPGIERHPEKVSQTSSTRIGLSVANEERSGTGASPLPPQAVGDEDDDDFGDFEDARVPSSEQKSLSSPAGYKSAETTKANSGYSRTTDSSWSGTRPTVRTKTNPSGPPRVEKKSGEHPFAGRMDLLFDAGEDEYDAGTDELGDLSSNPEAAMAYSKRLIAEQSAAHAKNKESQLDDRQQHPQSVAPYRRSLEKKETSIEQPQDRARSTQLDRSSQNLSQQMQRRSEDVEVLFDADAPDDDNDGWGDFEYADQSSSSFSIPQSSKGSFKDVNFTTKEGFPAIEGGRASQRLVQRPKQHEDSNKASPKPASQMLPVPATTGSWEQSDDAWEESGTTTQASRDYHSPRSPQPAAQVLHAKEKVEDHTPPTNIPPPAVVLSLFPSLFAKADDALFNTLNKLPSAQKQMLLTHSASLAFLRGFLNHCTVLAYIIAGRKLRWKRDQRLAQSVKIGPSAAGGKGGMKLTGVDKTEIVKEDREVFDAVQLYRSQMAKIQSAVTSATTAITSTGKQALLPPVPNVSEKMTLKTLKPTEGGITAPRPCALCGLRREERVDKVDKNVEDSFGEWWIDGLCMHLVCRDFWNNEGVRLRGK